MTNVPSGVDLAQIKTEIGNFAEPGRTRLTLPSIFNAPIF